MLVKIPSSQSPVVGLTQPNMSENSSSALGKTRASFTLDMGLFWSALSAAMTVQSAEVLPVAGFPATMTAVLKSNALIKPSSYVPVTDYLLPTNHPTTWDPYCGKRQLLRQKKGLFLSIHFMLELVLKHEKNEAFTENTVYQEMNHK